MRHATFAIAMCIALAAVQAVAQAQDIRGALPYRLYRTETAKSLQKSASPTDWALASQLLETSDAGPTLTHERAVLLRKAVEAAPSDRLVQWMWANATVLPSDCGSTSECSERAAAATRLDPDNAAACLPVIDGTWHAKDVAATEQALDRMAAAQRYEEPIGLAITEWLALYKRYPPPSLEALRALAPDGDGSLSMSRLAMIEAADSAQYPTSGLTRACDRSTAANAGAAHFASCGKIARLMLGHANSILGRAIGFAVLRASGEATMADVPAMREAAWQREQFDRLSPRGDVAEHDFLMDLAAKSSEVEAMHDVLERAKVPLAPPPTWQWMRHGQPVDMLHLPATAKAS